MKTNCFVGLCVSLGFAISADADLTLYGSRAAFDSAAPGLPMEDFENLTGSLSGGGVDVLTQLVINSSTSDPPIEPGDILDGITFSTVANDLFALLNPNAGLGITSNVFGPNFFADQMIMDFGPGVSAVGFDVFGLLNQPGFTNAEFFNGATSLGVYNFTNVTQSGSFGGGIAGHGDVITRVVLVNESTDLAEMYDNIAFGNVVVPEPNSLLLTYFSGLCFLARRRNRIQR